MRFKSKYFIGSGIFAHFFLVLIIILASKHFDLSPRQFISRLTEKAGFKSSFIDRSLMNDSFVEKYINYPFIPSITNASPRFLKQTRLLSQGKLTQADFSIEELKQYSPCLYRGPMWNTACYLLNKNSALEKPLIEQLTQFKLQSPNAQGHHGNGWQLAFMYDALREVLPLTKQQHIVINKLLAKAHYNYLLLLNDESASLWHGRASLASQLWLVLMAMDKPSSEQLASAAPHFYSLVEALSFTEAWPEGYTYWINSRAYTVVLALSSYLNGTESDLWHSKIKQILHKIGLWHIYATRPDNTIEPLGDEGPRLDLKDESRRIIDIIAQTTGDPVFSAYSQKIANIHQQESYYRDYRWGYVLFNERTFVNYPALTRSLAKMEVFGWPYLGQVYLHQSWLPTETFISFRSGDVFTHHGHYDSGHVSLFKGAPLLVNSSVYHGFKENNRLDYSIRTLSKNSIVFTGENQFEIDGGQRVVMPTGSAILSPNHWLDNRHDAQHLAAGKINHYYSDNKYSYIKSDITKAYDSSWYDSNGTGGQVKSVSRELLYLNQADVLLIRDEILTTSEKVKPHIVFHTQNQPEISRLTNQVGIDGNGISTTNAKEVKVKNNTGYLISEVFGDVENITLIGGKDYQYYVAHDKENKVEGVPEKVKKSASKWRFELNVLPGKDKRIVTTVHRPSIGNYTQKRTIEHRIIDGSNWYQLDNVAVVFGEQTDNLIDQLPKTITYLYQCGLGLTEKPTETGCNIIDLVSVD